MNVNSIQNVAKTKTGFVTPLAGMMIISKYSKNNVFVCGNGIKILTSELTGHWWRWERGVSLFLMYLIKHY